MIRVMPREAHPEGHMAMYDAEHHQWVSDYKQLDFAKAKGYDVSHGDLSQCFLPGRRFRHHRLSLPAGGQLRGAKVIRCTTWLVAAAAILCAGDSHAFEPKEPEPADSVPHDDYETRLSDSGEAFEWGFAAAEHGAVAPPGLHVRRPGDPAPGHQP